MFYGDFFQGRVSAKYTARFNSIQRRMFNSKNSSSWFIKKQPSWNCSTANRWQSLWKISELYSKHTVSKFLACKTMPIVKVRYHDVIIGLGQTLLLILIHFSEERGRGDAEDNCREDFSDTATSETACRCRKRQAHRNCQTKTWGSRL